MSTELSIDSIVSGEVVINSNTWVSCSKLYNYFNDDCLIDWLELYGKSNSLLPDKEIEYEQYQRQCIAKGEYSNSFYEFSKQRDQNSFRSFLMKQGQLYEKHVVGIIKQRFQNNVVDVGEQGFGPFDYAKKIEFTRAQIQQQTPIIYQGFVCNPKKQLFGFPDLLVREDFVPLLFNPSESDISCCSSFSSFSSCSSSCSPQSYVVVDIKFKSLDLKKNSQLLRCSQSQNFYISQLLMYTECLQYLLPISNDNIENDNIENDNIAEKLQNSVGYIIGRDWNTNSGFGMVRFSDVPEIKNKTNHAVIWIRTLRKQGRNWNPLAPDRLEMFPNMKNDKDNDWKQAKWKIANKIKELTMIWNIGPATRNQMILSNVRSWNSNQITNSFLEQFVSSPYQRSIILSMIEINKSSNKNSLPYRFDESCDIPLRWKSNDVKHYLEHFVEKNNSKNVIIYDGFIDIETMVDVFSISNNRNESLCYLIGLYYNRHGFTLKHKKHQQSMQYRPIVSAKINEASEKLLVKEFIEFLKMGEIDRHVVWRMYYYSQFDKSIIEKLFAKYQIHPNHFGITIEWAFDLHGLFTSYEFVFRNCFDYSLKSINRIMVLLGFIPEEFSYSTSQIQDGMQSILIAKQCHEQAVDKNVHLYYTDNFELILNYNTIDCVSLFYIRQFMESCVDSSLLLSVSSASNCNQSINSMNNMED